MLVARADPKDGPRIETMLGEALNSARALGLAALESRIGTLTNELAGRQFE
jgi:hypothetical protein